MTEEATPKVSREDMLKEIRTPEGRARMTPAGTAWYASGGKWKLAPHLKVLNRLLLKLAGGVIRRLVVTMHPRSGKSEMCSRHFPTWFLGTFQTDRVILVSYGDEFAKSWGRRARDDMTAIGKKVWGVTLRKDRQLAESWELLHSQGGMMTTGIGGSLTGLGAQLLIIDDPVKNAEEANSELMRDRAWEWYRSVAYTRLEPGGRILLIQCIAEGERVLRGDGRWIPIEEIAVGDAVWGYSEPGIVRKGEVTGARLSGEDDILEIRAGPLKLRLNKRHPVRVRGGWKQAGDLVVGDIAKTAMRLPHHGRKLWIPELKRYATGEFLWALGYLWGDGWVTKHARKNQNGAVSYAVCCAIGTRPDENERIADIFEDYFGRRPYESAGRYQRLDCNEAGRILERIGLTPGIRAPQKGLPDWIWDMRHFEKVKFLQGIVQADGTRLKTCKRRCWRFSSTSEKLVRGVRDLALTCGVRPGQVLSEVVHSQPPNSPRPLKTVTWSVSLMFNPTESSKRIQGFKITSIEPAGRSKVYDLSVEGLETFVAEGFIVHNTRWHEDDLGGRILQQAKDDSEQQWHIVNIPALCEEAEGDPLGREPGQGMWPQRYPADKAEIERLGLDPHLETLESIRANVGEYFWNALYQQRPSSPEGSLLRREAWQWYDTPPETFDEGLISLDAAFKETSSGSFVVIQTWGRKGSRLYLLDQRRERMDFTKTAQMMVAISAQYPKSWPKLIEDKANGSAVISSLQNEVYGVLPVNPQGGKLARAQAIQGLVDAGNIYLPRKAAWADAFVEECANFPVGRHDDQVDCMSQALTRFVGRLTHQKVQVATQYGTLEKQIGKLQRRRGEGAAWIRPTSATPN